MEKKLKELKLFSTPGFSRRCLIYVSIIKLHHGVVIHYEDDTHDKQEEEEEELLYGY